MLDISKEGKALPFSSEITKGIGFLPPYKILFFVLYFIHVYLSIYKNSIMGGGKSYLTVFDIYSALRKGLEIQLSLLSATFYKQSNKDVKAQ